MRGRERVYKEIEGKREIENENMKMESGQRDIESGGDRNIQRDALCPCPFERPRLSGTLGWSLKHFKHIIFTSKRLSTNWSLLNVLECSGSPYIKGEHRVL